MRRSYAAGVLLLIAWSAGCSDEKEGAGVGPGTSWQIFCALPPPEPPTTCPGSFNPHGPLDTDGDGKTDNAITGRCSRASSGINVTLDDPGESGAGKTRRTASQLRITRIDLAANECIVQLDDRDPQSGALLRLVDSCEGNGLGGTCTIQAKEDVNGYAIEGTITCTGMRNYDQGKRDFKLQAARSTTQAAVLQIANCD